MAYRRRNEVLQSIKKRVQNHGGESYFIYEAYLGIDPITKSVVRKYDKLKSRLEKTVIEFFGKLDSGGEAAVHLDRSQAMDAKMAFDLLREHKIRISLYECARAVIEKNSSPHIADVMLSDAYGRFLKDKASKSANYIKSIKSRIGAFVESIGGEREMSSITSAEIKDDLTRRLYNKDNSDTWKTYNNHLGDLKTFFKWCSSPEQGIITDNPSACMKYLEIPWKEPEYMKVDDFRKLIEAVRNSSLPSAKEDLAYTILSFFCGMRQAEIERVRNGEKSVKINLEDRFIRVIDCKGSTRGIRPRTFTIPDQALAWMRSFDFMDAIMRKNLKYRRHLMRYANDAKVYLPDNAGRKTFITMFDAVHHDQNKLSSIVGNTEDVRAENYNGLASEKEGREYMAIMP